MSGRKVIRHIEKLPFLVSVGFDVLFEPYLEFVTSSKTLLA